MLKLKYTSICKMDEYLYFNKTLILYFQYTYDMLFCMLLQGLHILKKTALINIL